MSEHIEWNDDKVMATYKFVASAMAGNTKLTHDQSEEISQLYILEKVQRDVCKWIISQETHRGVDPNSAGMMNLKWRLGEREWSIKLLDRFLSARATNDYKKNWKNFSPPLDENYSISAYGDHLSRFPEVRPVRIQSVEGTNKCT